MPSEEPAAWARERVQRLLAQGPTERVVASVVSSADSVAAVDGTSRALSSAYDRALVGAWREVADVLMVGGPTLKAERYGGGLFSPNARARRAGRGQPPLPPIVTTNRSGQLDIDAALRAREPLPLTVYVPPGADHRDRRVDYVELDPLTLTTMVADVQGRFHARIILCEPGPVLFSALLLESALTDISQTINPVTVGTGSRFGNGSAAVGVGGVCIERDVIDGHAFEHWLLGDPASIGNASAARA